MMISTWNVESITNYKQAHAKFENTRYPARSKKWAEHQRPLRNTASPHLRIERNEVHGVKCYDLCLYETALVRYFEPNAQGEQAVWLLNHYSCSSRKFLWNADWWNRKELTKQNGDKFILQLSDQAGLANKIWGEPFTCRLVFDMHGKVITEKSMHIPFTRRASTNTRRAKRKQLREHLTPVFDMLEMQYQSFIDNIEIDDYHGRPFSSRDYKKVSSGVTDKLRALEFVSLTPDELTELVHYAADCCRNIAQSIVNRRAWNYDTGVRLSWEETKRRKEQLKLPKDGALLSAHCPEIVERLTPTWEDIRKAVELDMQSLAWLDKGDEYLAYPQLATTFAQRCYAMPSLDLEDIVNMLGVETYDKLVSRKGVVY